MTECHHERRLVIHRDGEGHYIIKCAKCGVVVKNECGSREEAKLAAKLLGIPFFMDCPICHKGEAIVIHDGHNMAIACYMCFFTMTIPSSPSTEAEASAAATLLGAAFIHVPRLATERVGWRQFTDTLIAPPPYVDAGEF